MRALAGKQADRFARFGGSLRGGFNWSEDDPVGTAQSPSQFLNWDASPVPYSTSKIEYRTTFGGNLSPTSSRSSVPQFQSLRAILTLKLQKTNAILDHLERTSNVGYVA
jgi:hypothetical protein